MRFIWCAPGCAVIALILLCASPAFAVPSISVDLASRSDWSFRPERPTVKAAPLPVPAGGWRLNGFPNETAGVYERWITVPRLASGSQATRIEFEAVNWEATVYVGPDAAHLRTAGYHLSAWTPFSVDISAFVTPGARSLVRVAVRDRSFFKDAMGRYTVPAASEWNDGLARGIIRGVRLAVYPALYIDNVFVRPDTAADSLTYDVTVVNATDRPRTCSLDGTLVAGNPGAKWVYPVLPARRAMVLAPRETRVVTVGPVHWTPGRASWWWPNVPYVPTYRARLHTLTVQLRPGDAQARTQSARETVTFGFCRAGQNGSTYTFNGVHINLRGDSLPEGTIGMDAFARLAGFVPPAKGSAGWPGAVRNYQRLNYNVIRMHEVPCTRYMMSVCDELGMLVIPETAIRGPAAKANLTERPDSYATHVRELVQRDRNHPSVMKWSLENELFGAPEPFIKSLVDACMAADGTRPCSIDDNAICPSWPAFAVIEHYSQPPGTPDAAGGAPRTDRPFGQGEYVWPKGRTARGVLWFGLETRSMRLHGNSDCRPYTLIDVWPGVIPGLSPLNTLDPHLPSGSREQGGHALVDSFAPWAIPAIHIIQRSFAPVAVYDTEFDSANTPSDGEGEWPAVWPAVPAGQSITRSIEVFNDDLHDERITVTIAPVLRPTPSTLTALPVIVRPVRVPVGGHVTLRVEIPVPDVHENTVLGVTLSASKAGAPRYAESIVFIATPRGAGGTRAEYLGSEHKTRGNWPGTYGKEGFMVPIKLGRSNAQLPGIAILRGTGAFPPGKISPFRTTLEEQDSMIDLEKAASIDDARLPVIGPALTERDPTQFAGTRDIPLVMRVTTTDGKWHRLALYMLDYKREGHAMDIVIIDTAGHRIDSREIAVYSEGAYVQYRFRGDVLVVLKPLYDGIPTLSGLFVDSDPGPAVPE